MSATVVAVLGTDTGCGKTVLTAALAAAFRARGVRAAALKPVATGVEPGGAGEDAGLLAAATAADPADCVLQTLRLARSPLAAAEAEGIRLDVDALAARITALAEEAAIDVLLVEGVGGVAVPLTPTETVLDLVERVDAPVVLAARAGLGTINHTVLSVDACRNAGVRVLGVVLVDTEGGVTPDFAADNARRITAQSGAPVLGRLPHLDDPGDIRALAHAVAAAAIDVDALLAAMRVHRAGSAAATVARDRAHVWHPFTQTSEWLTEEPLVIRSARGCRVRTEDGRSLLDGIGALWANVHGYAHPRLDRALREQAGRVTHSTFLGQTHEPGARLAEELAARTPTGLTRVFFSEAGAAAVEVALRIALLAQRHRGMPQRTRFVSFEDGYHGDTAGAVSIGRSRPFHDGLDPLLFDCARIPAPHLVRVRQGVDAASAERRSLDALHDLLVHQRDRVAAVVVEPRVQGAAGIWPHSDAFLRELAALTHAAGALLVCDEVATGFGRTGDMFACAGAAVTPDILTLGKGLSGGYLPISATVVADELFELFSAPYAEHRTLYYGHTFSANPLACAVARASLALFDEEDTLERGRVLAGRLAQRLATEVAPLEGVAEVRQRGVMCGIEVAPAIDEPFPAGWRTGRAVALAARRRGVIVRPLGDVVVLNPALVMSSAEADELIAAVAESIVEVVAALPAMAGTAR